MALQPSEFDWDDVTGDKGLKQKLVSLTDVEAAAKRFINQAPSNSLDIASLMARLEGELGPEAVSHHSAVVAMLTDFKLRSPAVSRSPAPSASKSLHSSPGKQQTKATVHAGSGNRLALDFGSDEDSDLDVPLAVRLARRAQGVSASTNVIGVVGALAGHHSMGAAGGSAAGRPMSGASSAPAPSTSKPKPLSSAIDLDFDQEQADAGPIEHVIVDSGSNDEDEEEGGQRGRGKEKKGKGEGKVMAARGGASAVASSNIHKAPTVSGAAGMSSPVLGSKLVGEGATGSASTPAAVNEDGAGAGAAGDVDMLSKGTVPRGGVKLASSLPLVLSKNLASAGLGGRATMLVQIEDSALDLSGDVGAIGRLTALPGEGIILDLKGHQYAGTIVPCASFLVVGFGPTEARVEGIANDYVQVEHLQNVLASLAGSGQAGAGLDTLLDMEDVGETEGAAVLRKRGDDGADEDEEGEEGKGARATAGAKRKRGADSEEEDEDGAGDDEDYEEEERKKSGPKEASAKRIKGAFGRTVKVGKKKGKAKSKGKGKAKGKSKSKAKGKAGKGK